MKNTELNNGKADIDKILSIKGVRDYYDDGDLDKKEFDELYQKLLNNQAIVEKLDESIKNLQKLGNFSCQPSWKTMLNELEIIRSTVHSKCSGRKKDE